MKQRSFIFILAFAVGLIVTLIGCSSNQKSLQPVTEMEIYENYNMTAEQSAFYEEISVVIGEVYPIKSTAVVAVTMPDLKEYLQSGGHFYENQHTTEIEFPVQQVDGTWQISSIDPLTNYIRNESTQILIEMMESIGGVTVDFNPLEVMK